MNLEFVNNLIFYIGYPIFIAIVCIMAIHMVISICSPLIVKLIGDIGIENQCNKIKNVNTEQENKDD